MKRLLVNSISRSEPAKTNSRNNKHIDFPYKQKFFKILALDNLYCIISISDYVFSMFKSALKIYPPISLI